MAFDSGTLVSSAISRVRLKVGDINVDYPILDNTVYEYLLYENGSDELDTAIQALENIINYYSLNPTDEVFGLVSGKGYDPKQMEKRLAALKESKYTDTSGSKRIPVMVHSGRSNWDDFDNLFDKGK